MTDDKSVEKTPEKEETPKNPLTEKAFKLANEKLKSQPGPIQPAISKKFERLLEEEKKNLELGLPYIIFKKVENPPTKQDPRAISYEVPFVLYLDGCHANENTIRRYLSKPGWSVALYGNLDNQGAEENKRLEPVLAIMTERERRFQEFKEETGFRGKIESKKHNTKPSRRSQEDEDDYEEEDE